MRGGRDGRVERAQSGSGVVCLSRKAIMSGHVVYRAIVEAVRSGELVEPFSKADFKRACPGHGRGTYQAFLWKHKRANGKTSELFDSVSPGRFVLIRPFLYGLDVPHPELSSTRV